MSASPRVALPGLLVVLLAIAAPKARAAAVSDDTAWLRAQLAALDDPADLRDLAAWPAWRAARGGGFLGLVPDVPDAPDSMPIPAGPGGLDRTATWLLAQRDAARTAASALDASFPWTFDDRPQPPWTGRTPPGWSLDLDTSVPRAFLDALPGGVTPEEAAAIAALPANVQMLAHRNGLGYLPEPHADADALAQLMVRVGADTPLARIWCWLNPWNGFGYADLVLQADGYRRELDALAAHGRVLTGEALSRVARYAPADVTFHDTFALTVGWGIRGWATPAMGGLNLEHVKDDWDRLLGTLTEETCHRLQLRLVPTWSGESAASYEDLAAAATGNAGLDKLYELLTYTALEGSANLARGDLVADEVRDGAAAGAELVASFVDSVIAGGDVAAADGLINRGLRSNGPLYGLGWHLARALADAEGPRAVGERLRRGPVAFVQAAAAVDADHLLSDDVLAAVDALARLRNR